MKFRPFLVSLSISLIGLPSILAAEPEELTESDQAMAIAEEVAKGIEKLKKKYPNRLKGFSVEEHTTKGKEEGGFAPGTTSNPELASISFHNGIAARKVPAKKGKGKRQAVDVFDEKTGVRIYVHFFKGRARGNDMRPAEKFGDFNVHIYATGPAGKEIRADILKILEKEKEKKKLK